MYKYSSRLRKLLSSKIFVNIYAYLPTPISAILIELHKKKISSGKY